MKRKASPSSFSGDPPPAASPTTIDSFCDDVIAEFLVRLPSVPSLARAACAVKRWRRVASSPAFLRRFHALHHKPPLAELSLLLSPARSKHARTYVPGRRQRPRGARSGGTGSNVYASAAGHVQRQRQPAQEPPRHCSSPLPVAGRWPPDLLLSRTKSALHRLSSATRREEQSERERKGEKKGKRLSYVAS